MRTLCVCTHLLTKGGLTVDRQGGQGQDEGQKKGQKGRQHLQMQRLLLLSHPGCDGCQKRVLKSSQNGRVCAKTIINHGHTSCKKYFGPLYLLNVDQKQGHYLVHQLVEKLGFKIHLDNVFLSTWEWLSQFVVPASSHCHRDDGYVRVGGLNEDVLKPFGRVCFPMTHYGFTCQRAKFWHKKRGSCVHDVAADHPLSLSADYFYDPKFAHNLPTLFTNPPHTISCFPWTQKPGFLSLPLCWIEAISFWLRLFLIRPDARFKIVTKFNFRIGRKQFVLMDWWWSNKTESERRMGVWKLEAINFELKALTNKDLRQHVHLKGFNQ